MFRRTLLKSSRFRGTAVHKHRNEVTTSNKTFPKTLSFNELALVTSSSRTSLIFFNTSLFFCSHETLKLAIIFIKYHMGVYSVIQGKSQYYSCSMTFGNIVPSKDIKGLELVSNKGQYPACTQRCVSVEIFTKIITIVFLFFYCIAKILCVIFICL